MDLTQYFKMQRELYKYIEKKHPREIGESRVQQKTLALLVEVGEMVNELPELFKFWSNKTNNTERALEEYIDILHFFLSIGIEEGLEEWMFRLLDQRRPPIRSVLEQSLYLFETIGQYSITGHVSLYITAFREFLTLGELLGFTEEMIDTAYRTKNAENYERQNNGY